MSVLHCHRVGRGGRALCRVMLSDAPFCTRDNNRMNSANMLMDRFRAVRVVSAGGRGGLPVRFAGGLPRRLRTPVVTYMSASGHTTYTTGRSTARLLSRTLHRMLNRRMRRGKSLMAPRSLHFSFSRFRGMASRRVHQMRRLIGTGVHTGVPLGRCHGVPVRRTGRLNTVTLFKRGCNSEIHIVRFKSSVRFYNNVRITTAKDVNVVGVVSRDSITTNIHHVRTCANTEIRRVLSAVRSALGSLETLFGGAPSLNVTVHGCVSRGTKLGGRLRSFVGRGRTSIGRHLLGGVRRVGNFGIVGFYTPVPTRAIGGVTFRLHKRVARGLFFMTNALSRRGPVLAIVVDSGLITDKLGTKGLIGRTTGLVRNNNNKRPRFTATNNGGPSKLGTTMRGILRLTKVWVLGVRWGMENMPAG